MNNRTIRSKITWWAKHHLIFLVFSAATAAWSSPLEPPRRIQSSSGSLEQLPRAQRPTSLHSNRSKDSSEGGEGHRSQAQHHQQSCESTSSRSSTLASSSASTSASGAAWSARNLQDILRDRMIGEQVGRRVLTGRRGSKTSEAAFVFFYIDSVCGTQFCR